MFSNHRFSTVVGAAVWGAALGLAALVTSATAGADTTDDAFISQMTAMGVTFSSPSTAVKDGHQVCKELASGKSGTDIAAQVVSMTDLAPRQAAFFVVDATNAYCPEYASEPA